MDVFHREEVLAVLFADVEHLHDVLMMKTGGQACFVDEHRDEATVARMLGADALQHDVTLEAFDAVRTAEQNIGHSAGREMLEDAITTERRIHR